MRAEFFYRNPLKKGEPKPAFGVEEPNPDRPDHKGFMKEVFNAREEDHSLSESGFILLNHKSAINNFYDDKEVTEIYYDEMANLVKKKTGAAQVFIVSHITRNEAEAAEGKRLGAHRLVHNDFTPNFKQTIQPLLDENGSNPSRITVYNLWRRFDEDGTDAPFALCDSRTVSEKELIPTDLFNYGKEEEKTETLADENGFTVEIYQSMNSESHKWYFYPKMNRDEVVMFKTYDSNEKPFMPTLHSAFDDPTSNENASPRESIEVRAICFFD
mgnify:FL=1